MEPFKNPAELSAKVIKQAALQDAWDRAIQTMPALSLLDATGGSLARAMAEMIDQALAAGVIEHEELVEAALQRIPKLRTPNGHNPQHP